MSVSWYQKKVYEAVFGAVPKGFHIHRVTPGYLGGKYIIGNMIALSHDDHVLIHKYRWLRYRDKRDYVAYKLLQERRGLSFYERCSLGGIVSGKFRDTTFQQEQGRKGGKAGLGPHVDMAKYSESRVAGGKVSALKAKTNPNAALYKRTTCQHCNKDIRQVDLRWHRDARCLRPGKTNDLT